MCRHRAGTEQAQYSHSHAPLRATTRPVPGRDASCLTGCLLTLHTHRLASPHLYSTRVGWEVGGGGRGAQHDKECGSKQQGEVRPEARPTRTPFSWLPTPGKEETRAPHQDTIRRCHEDVLLHKSSFSAHEHLGGWGVETGGGATPCHAATHGNTPNMVQASSRPTLSKRNQRGGGSWPPSKPPQTEPRTDPRHTHTCVRYACEFPAQIWTNGQRQ